MFGGASVVVKFEPNSKKSNNTTSVARMLTSISRNEEMNELISTCWHQLGWSVKVLMACDGSFPSFIFLSYIYIKYTRQDLECIHELYNVYCVC